MPIREPLPPELTHSPFSVTRAKELKVTPGRLRSSDLMTPFHGVRVTRRPRDVLARFVALAQRLPEHAFLCDSAAAQVYGVPLPTRLLHTTLHIGYPAPHRAPSGNGIVGHRYSVDAHEVITLGEAARRFGLAIPAGSEHLRITSPERTWCDIAKVLCKTEMIIAGDHLANWRREIATVPILQEAAQNFRGRRGKQVLMLAAGRISKWADSPPETLVRLGAIACGFPGWEPAGETKSGKHVDVLFRKFGVGFEYEGDHHRTEKDQWRRDVFRVNEMQLEGLTIDRVTGDDLAAFPAFLRRMEKLLRQHGWDGKRTGSASRRELNEVIRVAGDMSVRYRSPRY